MHSTLARLQQALTLWTLAWALAWLAWIWPYSPTLALAGFFTLTLGYAVVLALEFILLVRIARDDPAPRATPWELVQAWAHEARVALQVFAWRQPFRWRAVPDRLAGQGVAGRHGVVLVHGFVCNRGFWTPWLRSLRAEDRAVVAVNLEPVFGSIDAYAPILQDAVARVRQATGLPPVLVCHSMGGLAARAWLRTVKDPHQAVAHVVTIGSPHAGTWLARFSHLPNGRQMRTDSAWMQALRDHWTPALAIRFTCWYSNCDNIVMPPSTATLAGADNRLLRGAAHIDLAFRPQVLQDTRTLLETLDRQAWPGGT
jgi:predicted alpha/beta hydrolase family esterase